MTSSNSTDKREVRKFGLIVFLFFGALFALALWREKTILSCFFGTLWFLGVCFLVAPAPSRPLYAGWLRVAHFIGRALTTLLLALTYYLAVTPTAWLKRLFGGRPIKLKPDPDASTYWVDRPEPAQPLERFVKRF